MAINVFISYAHEDISYKTELLKRLKPLTRSGVINVWHDGEITAGEKWDASIKANLTNADIVILLISVDFIDSDYIFEEELPTIIAKRAANQLTLIPIVVRDANLEGSNIEDYQCLPQDSNKRLKPIVQWINEGTENEVWVQIDQKIRAAIETSKSKPPLVKNPAGNKEFKLNTHHVYTCDRVDQSDEFNIQNKVPQKVQYYYLFGQKYQSTQGFFNRIKYEKQGILLDYLNPNAAAYRKVESFEVTFELSKNKDIYLQNIYKSLLSSFYNNIDELASLSNHTILDVLADSPKIKHLRGKDYLCILLMMSQEDWYKEITPQVVKEVISEFFDHRIAANQPSILVFFSTTYEENDGEIEQEIREAVIGGEYLKILPELEKVENNFVIKWFEKYNAFFKLKPKQLDTFRQQYFQAEIYDMDDIETELERLLDEYFGK